MIRFMSPIFYKRKIHDEIKRSQHTPPFVRTRKYYGLRELYTGIQIKRDVGSLPV